MNRKNMFNKAVFLAFSVAVSASLCGCSFGKKPVEEIDRTYETTTEAVTTKAPTVAATESTTQATTQAATSATAATEKPTQKVTVELETETTAVLQGIDVYLLDKESIFYTLPEVDFGSFVGYSSTDNYDTLKLSAVPSQAYEEYKSDVLASSGYSMDSQLTGRAYINRGDGKKVTLIYFEGMMLITVGDAWDTYSYYQEQKANEVTLPAETKDARNQYFENKDGVFGCLPYLEAGTFGSYEEIENGAIMTVTGISDSDFDNYSWNLITSGFNNSGLDMNGNQVFENTDYFIFMSNNNGTLTIKVVKNIF